MALSPLSRRTALGAGTAALALPPVHAVPVLLVSIPGLLVLAGAAPSRRCALPSGAARSKGQAALTRSIARRRA